MISTLPTPPACKALAHWVRQTKVCFPHQYQTRSRLLGNRCSLSKVLRNGSFTAKERAELREFAHWSAWIYSVDGGRSPVVSRLLCSVEEKAVGSPTALEIAMFA